MVITSFDARCTAGKKCRSASASASGISTVVPTIFVMVHGCTTPWVPKMRSRIATVSGTSTMASTDMATMRPTT